MPTSGKMNEIAFRKEIGPVTTIVVKTGSRILTTPGHEKSVAQLVSDLVALHTSGIRVVLVSSGAIAHGMQAMKLEKRPSTIPLQQACASVGQNRLMNRYQSSFEKYNILIGQVLLTWDDLRSKKRYLNLRNTMFQLLDSGIIPIINENDSVGIEEIRFGTNDILGAQMAILAQADVFVNLTDVGGLFDKNPHDDPSARHIPVVTKISASIEKLVTDKKNEISVGGMSSKLKAVDMVTKAGIFALIGDGFNHRLLDVLTKESHSTLFLPADRKMSSRHRWIAFTGSPQGKISIDDGAFKAVGKNGKSLLAAGIKTVSGTFSVGDSIEIIAPDGTLVARGLVNYSSEEINLIKGCKSSEIAVRLGQKEFDEVVHRDNLVLI